MYSVVSVAALPKMVGMAAAVAGGCRVERVGRKGNAVVHRAEHRWLAPQQRDQRFDRHGLQRCRGGPADAQGLRHAVRQGRGLLRGRQTQAAGAALCDGLVEQAARGRAGEQGADLGAATGLAEDGDVAGVAAERCDVVADPAQGRHHVQHPGIAGLGETLVRIVQPQEAKQVQPVVDRHDHHIAVPRQHRAVEPGRRPGATHPRAAVQPNHHRPLARLPPPSRRSATSNLRIKAAARYTTRPAGPRCPGAAERSRRTPPHRGCRPTGRRGRAAETGLGRRWMPRRECL